MHIKHTRPSNSKSSTMNGRFVKILQQAEKGVDKALGSVIEDAFTEPSPAKQNLICGANSRARLLIAPRIWVPNPGASKNGADIVHAR